FRTQAGQDGAEAVALRADTVCRGNDHSVEKHLVRIDGMAAHFVDDSDGDAAAVEIRVEQAQPLGLAIDPLERRGASKDEDLVGDLRGGYPDFLTREHVVVAAALGADLYGRG